MNQVPPVALRQLSPDWAALCMIIEQWAIRDDFAVSVQVKDTKWADYICRLDECDWIVFPSRNQHSEIQLKMLHERHSCIGRGRAKREVHNSQAWLRCAVQQHLFIIGETTTRQNIKSLQVGYGVTVNSETAKLAQAALINDQLEHQQEQFRQIPAYLELLHSINPGYIQYFMR